MDNYLDSLNPSQRAAVEYCDGPQLVIAGAGSGKTRVLTMKIAHLLRNGYKPNDIIALTFTKKAATEMQNRINQLVPGAARSLWMGTFHSLFSRILRREAERLGFPHDFTIYDQTDSRSLIKAIIKELNLDDKQYKPNSVANQISNAKNNLVTPGMYLANKELMSYDAAARRPRIGDIYQIYWNRCIQAGAMDFDDLLLYTNILFRDHPDVLEFYQDYFKYVLVDEYQDTNRAQHLIVEQLARKHKRLCVVGDDAQSIYSFRGANIRNILDMQRQIPGTKLYKLEQNYRSTQNIVDAANSLIAHNRDQIKKTIFSAGDKGSLLKLTGSYSDIEEAYKVSKQIQALHNDEGFDYHDCAILYRTNAQSRNLEEALRKADIDYQIFGGLSFYQRKEIKDVIAYLRLITNPSDEEAFKRVVNYPTRGIGATTIAKLVEGMRISGANLYEICSDPIAFNVPVNKGTEGKLKGFCELIRHFRELNETLNAYELTDRVISESKIKEDLANDMTVEGQSRRENIQELMSAIQSFVITCVEEGNPNNRLIDFLADVSLSGAVEPAEQTDSERDCVAMMTIHQAKGLEFKNVFIVGVEENLLPSDMSRDEPGGVEEERRLFYVAITRAEKNCFLSYAKSRFRNGKSDVCTPSRFLKDIDRQYIEQESGASYTSHNGGSFETAGNYGNPWGNWQRTSQPKQPVTSRPTNVLDLNRPRKVAVRQESELPSTQVLTYGGKILQTGTRIAHERFGEGVIVALAGQEGDARITVKFDNVGEKTLLLKFAKFTLI
ncbi:MAG: 3'-5' exonuclease [Bacteroidales bacterium]|nr:3'-5' exonuclease [Bacteroidales bacterium]